MAIFTKPNFTKADNTAQLGYMASKKLRVTTSTQIILKVQKRNELEGENLPKLAVGAVQSLNPTTNRTVTEVREMGSDHIVELVPGVASFTMSLGRIQIDRMKIAEAFGIDYRDIHSQIFPFDIEMLETYVDPDPKATPRVVQYVTTYLDCMFESVNFTIDVTGNLLITDNATVKCTRITTKKKQGRAVDDLDDIEVGDSIEAIADYKGVGPRDVINSYQ